MLAELVAGLIALAEVQGGVPRDSPPATPPIPPLPEGRLLLFAGNGFGANFLALDQTSKSGSEVDAWVFTVPAQPYNLMGHNPDRRVAQYLRHLTFDCARRGTYVELSEDAFNEAGQRVVWLPAESPQPIEPRSTEDFLAKVMCDGQNPPDSNIVIGHSAAVRVAHLILSPPQT